MLIIFLVANPSGQVYLCRRQAIRYNSSPQKVGLWDFHYYPSRGSSCEITKSIIFG